MRLRAATDPVAGRLAGLVLGLAGGWFGLAAGFLIGFMVDLVRAGRSSRAYLRAPSGRWPPEYVEGLAAAAALAKLPATGGQGTEPRTGKPDPAELRRIFVGIALETLGPVHQPGKTIHGWGQGILAAIGEAARRLVERELSRQFAMLFEAAMAEDKPDLPALERDLSLRGTEEARTILARSLYAIARLDSAELGHDREAALRAVLADSGCAALTTAAARKAFFPDYLDAWEILGLEPGFDEKALRQAYRARCRKVHPDARRAGEGSGAGEGAREGEDPAADFRRLRQAYDYLVLGFEPEPASTRD